MCCVSCVIMYVGRILYKVFVEGDAFFCGRYSPYQDQSSDRSIDRRDECIAKNNIFSSSRNGTSLELRGGRFSNSRLTSSSATSGQSRYGWHTHRTEWIAKST